jgi:hypothetical protein
MPYGWAIVTLSLSVVVPGIKSLIGSTLWNNHYSFTCHAFSRLHAILKRKKNQWFDKKNIYLVACAWEIDRAIFLRSYIHHCITVLYFSSVHDWNCADTCTIIICFFYTLMPCIKFFFTCMYYRKKKIYIFKRIGEYVRKHTNITVTWSPW